MTDLHEHFDLDARTARTIAAGMREVAQADGEQHPMELALIQAFEQELPAGEDAEVELAALTNAESKEVFLKSLVLVAMADGRISEEEVVVIRGYADQLDLDEGVLTDLIQQVSVMMLSHFTGVIHFRDQAHAIGRALGLDDTTIERVLTTGG
jgi:uncharacterized tellurite resistance protein B-like protein